MAVVCEEYLFIVGTVCPKKTQAHSLLVLKARQLSELAQLRYSISNIDQCNSQFYYDLYKALTGLKIHWSSGFTEDLRCQVIVDSFEEYLSPHIKLGHIQGYNLARSDPVTVGNMLDVLIALLKTYPGNAFLFKFWVQCITVE